MNVKKEIKKLKVKIEKLEHDLGPQSLERILEGVSSDLKMASHVKMAKGPWEDLGVEIEKNLSKSIKHIFDKDADGEIQPASTFKNAIKTSKDLCRDFFDTFEKQVDLMRFQRLSAKNKTLKLFAKMKEK